MNRLLVLLVIMTWCCEAPASDVARPIAVRDLGSAALPFGLPRARGGMLALGDKWQAGLEQEFVQNFTQLWVEGERQLIFDGETSVTTFSVQRGIGSRFEVGMDLPWIYHSGGHLDGLIKSFHDLTGASGRDREGAPRGQIACQWLADGMTVFDINEPVSGIGDITLRLGWQAWRKDGRGFALRGTLKAPTGDPDKLTGSSAWDTSLYLEYTDAGLVSGRLAITAAAGLMVLGDGEFAPAQQENTAWTGHLGLGWRFTDKFAGKAQLDSHAALFDSPLPQVGDAAIMATFGVTWNFSPRWWLDAALVEDVLSSATPDVVFLFGLAYRP